MSWYDITVEVGGSDSIDPIDEAIEELVTAMSFLYVREYKYSHSAKWSYQGHHSYGISPWDFERIKSLLESKGFQQTGMWNTGSLFQNFK